MNSLKSRATNCEPCSSQNPINTGRTDRNHIGVEHHKGNTSITLQRMDVVEVDNRPFLPVLQPMVARNQCIVFGDLAIMSVPTQMLARGDTDPAHETADGQLSQSGPVADLSSFHLRTDRVDHN